MHTNTSIYLKWHAISHSSLMLVRLIGLMHCANHVAFLCLSPVQMFEQLLHHTMRSRYEYKNGETGVTGARKIKQKNPSEVERGGGRSYHWDYLTSHLPCNLAQITTRLGTSTNTPVNGAAKTNPTGERDKNTMKLWFILLWWLLFFNQDVLLCC